MKKFIITAIIGCLLSVSVLAQETKNPTQVSTIKSGTDNQPTLFQLLTYYYNIKDALVKSSVSSAVANASEFARIAKGIDPNVVSKHKLEALLKDAEQILKSKDIGKQREYFAQLSTNMYALAKEQKLSDVPVYQQYCPMKKASWLSSSMAIKNPYYGSAMLTCGEVQETIN